MPDDGGGVRAPSLPLEAPVGREVDMASEMTALTLEIIAQTMFSTSSARLAWLINETVRNVIAANSFSLLDIAPLIGGPRLKARDARMRAIFAELDAASIG